MIFLSYKSFIFIIPYIIYLALTSTRARKAGICLSLAAKKIQGVYFDALDHQPFPSLDEIVFFHLHLPQAKQRMVNI